MTVFSYPLVNEFSRKAAKENHAKTAKKKSKTQKTLDHLCVKLFAPLREKFAEDGSAIKKQISFPEPQKKN